MLMNCPRRSRRRSGSRREGELRQRLLSALETLPERQRAVILLHDVEGYKHAEIGKMLDIPEGTARSDLHYARSQLRQVLGALRQV